MEHICYLSRKKLDALSLSDSIALLLRERKGMGKVCQIFEKDRVYLATKQKQRKILWEAVVCKVEKTERSHLKSREGETVYYVDSWMKWSQSQIIIRIQLIKRVDLPLEGAKPLLTANWESIGHLV